MCGLSFASLFHWLVFLLDVEEDTLICFLLFYACKLLMVCQSLMVGVTLADGRFLTWTWDGKRKSG